jgi:hypothetical protein
VIVAATPLKTGPGTWIEVCVVKPVLKFIVARLSEVSTYKGIALALTGVGLYVRPEIAAAVTSIGLGIAGLIGIVTADPAPPAAE